MLKGCHTVMIDPCKCDDRCWQILLQKSVAAMGEA
jgi:hypothetical protein